MTYLALITGARQRREGGEGSLDEERRKGTYPGNVHQGEREERQDPCYSG